MGGLEALIVPAVMGAGGTALGTAAATGLGAAAGGLAATAGGILGGAAGSTLGQVLQGGGKGAIPDLPSMAGQPAGLGQTMGKQGAFAVPVPPPIQSASVMPIGAAMPQVQT